MTMAPKGCPDAAAADFAAQNKATLASLHRDKHADMLLAEMEADAEVARMTKPVRLEEIDTSAVLLAGCQNKQRRSSDHCKASHCEICRKVD